MFEVFAFVGTDFISEIVYTTPRPIFIVYESFAILGFLKSLLGLSFMPIYEYSCKSCGFEKDVLQKMSDDPLTKCPSCEADTFAKRISAAGFRLSGNGWYETDFKTGAKKNLSKDAAESSTAS